jgi:uncharacterized phage protein (TIGR02218 family)
MRQIPFDLAEHLAGEATTTCHCWRAARRDGVALGFTDHDEDIAFDGTLFRAASGLDAAEAQADLGFATGGGEVAGALGDDSLSETDLAAGLWDSAKVEMFLVNWRMPDQRIRLKIGEIGEVRRAGTAFTAELRSMAHRLEATCGRLYGSTCDAELGDARCGRDVTGPEFRGTGAVTAVTSRFELAASGLDAYETGWFRGGIVSWVSGANAGQISEVREHRTAAGTAKLALWQATPFPVEAGDAFTVTAGCDKTFETCRERFANTANFRGFPHMPGTDRALAYAGGEGNLDGGSLFR